MKVQTALNQKAFQKFKKKTEELNLTPYKLAQSYIENGLDASKKTPLSEYTTRELLTELWIRLP